MIPRAAKKVLVHSDPIVINNFFVLGSSATTVAPTSCSRCSRWACSSSPASSFRGVGSGSLRSPRRGERSSATGCGGSTSRSPFFAIRRQLELIQLETCVFSEEISVSLKDEVEFLVITNAVGSAESSFPNLLRHPRLLRTFLLFVEDVQCKMCSLRG